MPGDRYGGEFLSVASRRWWRVEILLSAVVWVWVCVWVAGFGVVEWVARRWVMQCIAVG